jgi:release factor glutamine methyltransferase
MGKKFEPHADSLPNIPSNIDKEDLTYADFLEGTREILRQSQEEGGPYTTTVAGREFIVLPNVFSPKYFNDTELFALHLPVCDGDTLLEMGSGTGAVSITALYRGASRVVAVDINPDAVRNTEENIKKHGMETRAEARQGNLYDALIDEEKFDVIFWNTPFGFVEEQNLTDLEKSVWDTNYEVIERFIKEARLHLKPKGRLYIGFSSTMGNMDRLTKIASHAGYSLKPVYEAETAETHPVNFEIFEAVRN